MTYFIHDTACVDELAKIGSGSKIWHYSHIMNNATIGENCNLGQNVFVSDGVSIGNNVKIQNNVSLYNGVICEDDVFIGPSVVFTNVHHPRSHVSRKNEYLSTHIGKGASIGANATIVCGNSIGAYSFVGAGSVVTHDVVPYALVFGNPARQVGWVCECGNRLNNYICQECGKNFTDCLPLAAGER